MPTKRNGMEWKKIDIHLKKKKQKENFKLILINNEKKWIRKKKTMCLENINKSLVMGFTFFELSKMKLTKRGSYRYVSFLFY